MGSTRADGKSFKTGSFWHRGINGLLQNRKVKLHVPALQEELYFQDPAGIFDLIEVVGNGTYGQVYKVR